MPESTGRPTSDGSSGSDTTGTEDYADPADLGTGDATPDPTPDGTPGEVPDETPVAPRSAPTATKSTGPKAGGKREGKRDVRTAGPVVPPKAKAKAKVVTAETRAATARARATAPNPEWWVPVFVTLLVLGLAWIVVFYISQGAFPVAAFGYWNLVAGFALLIAGFGMAMRWR